jgi:hypothetical protein
MWENLRSRYDTGTTSIRRLTLKRKFSQTKPQTNESINVFFDTLLGYYNRLQGTPEEITEESMKAHIYTQLPPEFRPTVVVLQHRANVSLEEVMDSLREDEETQESYNANKEDEPVAQKETEALAANVQGSQQTANERGSTNYRGGNKGRGGHRGHSYNPYISKYAKASNNSNVTCFACEGRSVLWSSNQTNNSKRGRRPGKSSMRHAEKEEEESSNTLPPTQVFSDNQGALVTVKSGALKARFKHVDVRFHRSRDLQENGIVNFEYVNTKENLADLLTKPLPAPAHQRLTSMIGLTSH